MRAIIEREKVISTGVGIGIALPHVKIPCVKDFIAAVGRSHKGIDFNSLDDHPVNIVVMIGAIVKVHLARGFFASGGGFEFNLALIGLLAAILVAGPGRFALGRVLPLPKNAESNQPIAILE